MNDLEGTLTVRVSVDLPRVADDQYGRCNNPMERQDVQVFSVGGITQEQASDLVDAIRANNRGLNLPATWTGETGL